MSRFRLLLPALALFACASSEKKAGGDAGAAAPSEETDVMGAVIVRTARAVGFDVMLEELAEADVVYVGASRPAVAMTIVDSLFGGKRLHGIGLQAFERGMQDQLDAYVLDHSVEESELADRTGVDIGPWRGILGFAREKRLPVIALGVPAEILGLVRAQGLGALTQEQRRALPALRVPGDLEDEFLADGVVRWFRTAPDDAQLVVVADRARLAPKTGVLDRARRRLGRTHKSVIPLAKGEEAEPQSARTYADFLWVIE